jgi:hypothetical protein
MARVNRGHWQEQVEPNWGDLCHILLGVRLPSASQQQTYLCDVGFGAPHGACSSLACQLCAQFIAHALACRPVVRSAALPLLLEEGLEQTDPQGYKFRVARKDDLFLVERLCTVRSRPQTVHVFPSS